MLARVLPRAVPLVWRSGRCASSVVPSTSSGEVRKKDDEMFDVIHIDDLPRAQKRFAKQFEKVNEQRVKELFVKNKKNLIALFAFLCLVVFIYFYTMHAVKQETFLEEIDEEMAREDERKKTTADAKN